MTSRTLKATVSAPAADVIGRLADDLSFAGYADDILSVSDVGDGLRAWVLAFRGSTATWVQRSRRVADGPESYRIEFQQVEGQFQRLEGSWTATDLPDGCEVVFEVLYSTSVPHLAGAIDSAVGRVLVRIAHRVLSTVAGPVHITAGGHYLRDLVVA